MVNKSGRLSRWSQLKSKGGASDIENRVAEEAIEAKQKELSNPDKSVSQHDDELAITEGFPLNPYKRPAAPVMAPLAGYDEMDSDFEAPPKEALAMLNGEIAHNPAGDLPPLDAEAGDDDAVTERELTPEEAEAVAALPPIDTLTNESDFTPFMSGKIPEFIRRKALKVLYQSHPILGFRDGLNDYDEDYNLIDTLINASTQSTYEVGKGQEAAQEAEEVEEVEVAIEDAENTEDQLPSDESGSGTDENAEVNDHIEVSDPEPETETPS